MNLHFSMRNGFQFNCTKVIRFVNHSIGRERQSRFKTITCDLSINDRSCAKSLRNKSTNWNLLLKMSDKPIKTTACYLSIRHGKEIVAGVKVLNSSGFFLSEK